MNEYILVIELESQGIGGYQLYEQYKRSTRENQFSAEHIGGLRINYLHKTKE